MNQATTNIGNPGFDDLILTKNLTMPGVKRKRNVVPSSSEDKDKKTHNDVQEVEISHWLMKSEPESRLENGVDMKFGIDDLMQQPDQTAPWDGVRNYLARNHLRKMRVGHKAFFYHSNCKVPGIVGLVEILREAYTDPTQFDPANPHFDARSSRSDPKWSMVDVKFERKLKRYISLPELKKLHLEHKASGGPLARLALFCSSRLSVQPVTDQEFEFILSLENITKI